jgi:hypothetical protein
MKEKRMKSIIVATAISALTAGSTLAAAHTWTGAISDKMCGADHKAMGVKMTDRECTEACAKGGASYVLLADGKVFQLTNHDAELRTHAGHIVMLTGELKGETIRIAKIEMPKATEK